MPGGPQADSQGVASERPSVRPQPVPDCVGSRQQIIGGGKADGMVGTVRIQPVTGPGRRRGRTAVRIRGGNGRAGRRARTAVAYCSVRDRRRAGCITVLQDAGQQLDRDQQGDGRAVRRSPG